MRNIYFSVFNCVAASLDSQFMTSKNCVCVCERVECTTLGEKELMAVCKRGGVWRVWYVCCNKTVYWAVVVRRRSQSFSLHGEHGGTHTVSTYTAVCPNGVLPGPSQGVLYNGSFWNAGPRTSSSRFPAPRFGSENERRGGAGRGPAHTTLSRIRNAVPRVTSHTHLA